MMKISSRMTSLTNETVTATIRQFLKHFDDLTENNILISGEDDGRFDGSDYILFYAVGADKGKYDPLSKNTFSN